MSASRRRSWAFDFFLIALFAAVLIKPLFKVKYLDNWGSVESTFASDGRFLRDHWPHPLWQPLWYCGTRFDYVYPPALRYATAGLTKIFPIIPIRAYHLYTALFYCLGIAGVYLFARVLFNTASGFPRVFAWLAALATALVSPSFLLMQKIRDDALFSTPQRLGVLVRYAEGPHMTAVAWLGFALAFGWRALRHHRPLDLALASISCAMVVSNNFYGATSLAILFPVLAWSLYITHLDRLIWVRAAAIAMLAYGLTAFWLVPSYLQITIANMRLVAQKGSLWSMWLGLAVVVAFVILSDKWARGKREQAHTVFLAGALALMSLNVLGEYYFNFRVIGEPSRMVPILDLVLILTLAEGLRRLWNLPGRAAWGARAAALLVVGLGIYSSTPYLQNAWKLYKPDLRFDERVEYRLQDWIYRNMPDSRAMAAGSIRFWYNTWHDLAQVGGVSEQGSQNGAFVPAQWQILIGEDAELSKLWMQILGADAVIVNFKNSREHYHDYQFPEKFQGKLPVLHDNGEGDIIYQVPRRYSSLARVVDTAQLHQLPGEFLEGDVNALRAYASVIEGGPEAPTATKWEGTDVLRVRAPVADGQSIFVQVTYDSSWRAYSGDRPLPVVPSKLGFLEIVAPPGPHDIRLIFKTPLSNIVGRVITVISLAIACWLIYTGWRRRGEFV